MVPESTCSHTRSKLQTDRHLIKEFQLSIAEIPLSFYTVIKIYYNREIKRSLHVPRRMLKEDSRANIFMETSPEIGQNCDH